MTQAIAPARDAAATEPVFVGADALATDAVPHSAHLLDVDTLSQSDFAELIASAEQYLRQIRTANAKSDALRGISIYTLFYEDSTRTRVSFEQAGKWLGADVINIAVASSSVNKGESLLNTTETLNATGADIIVVRHPHAGAPYFVARRSQACVVNAGDGMHAHPTQALLDVMTLQRRIGDLRGKRIAIIGDVAHSRVARSSIAALSILGADVEIAGPATLLPSDWRLDSRQGFAFPFDRVRIHPTADDALTDADAVMTLRLQRERQTSGLVPDLAEYTRLWGIDRRRLALAKPNAPMMHPGPMNEGIEIASDVAHGNQSVVANQVENGVAMRMAVLQWLHQRRTRAAA